MPVIQSNDIGARKRIHDLEQKVATLTVRMQEAIDEHSLRINALAKDLNGSISQIMDTIRDNYNALVTRIEICERRNLETNEMASEATNTIQYLRGYTQMLSERLDALEGGFKPINEDDWSAWAMSFEGTQARMHIAQYLLNHPATLADVDPEDKDETI